MQTDKIDNKIEFKFTLPNVDSGWCIPNIISHYKVIFDSLMKQVFKIEGNLELEVWDLKYTDSNGNYANRLTQDYNDGVKNESFNEMSPYIDSYKIVYKHNSNIIFSFLIYGQNNCCGAMTTSVTNVSYKYTDCKLAHIIQHLKEAIAVNQKVTRLVCTDIYNKGYTGDSSSNLKDLAPYLPNTKVLLNSEWRVSELFYNKNSYNVVGIFIKDVPSSIKSKEITMKIQLPDEKLIKIENVTIGGDPELFLRNKTTGDYIPSFYVMKGDKVNPTPITDKGHAIQCDNVMVEYNFSPSTTADEFVDNNMLVQNYLTNTVANPNNLELVIFPSAEFKPEHLTSDLAKAFGCSSDYDVYKEGRPNTVGKSIGGLRTAGKIVCQV